tara:strand:- start:16554 stop:16898 length:345 start_codon:yes stop_codon:yes gene_type:complete
MTRRNKYGAKPQVVDGVRFASGREANRWVYLSIRARMGEILELERQVRYELAPGVRIAGEKRARPALRFTADFRYRDRLTGDVIVEDAKGKADTAFRIRQHLMKSVHNIDVRLS